MPADVAVRPPTHLLSGSAAAGPAPLAEPPAPLPWSAEELSGRLALLGPGSHRQDVLVRVYRTSLEHFAVLYPAHKSVSRPLGVLNLRNTRVEALAAPQSGFTVRQRAPDAPNALTFVPLEEARALEEWLLAFTWRGSPSLHASPLPAVQEDEEV
ncbi:hypothetical protein R5R35_001037 [Gryllus longicercus]|uniref:Uncharacterized protein n=1 Tax=Gryllus longicercus TaxID=2509291 RepID=A0AAN9V6F2_9ORTH